MPPLIDGVAFGGLLADKAFDNNALVAELNKRGARIVMSQHPARAQKLKIDAAIYDGATSSKNSSVKSKN